MYIVKITMLAYMSVRKGVIYITAKSMIVSPLFGILATLWIFVISFNRLAWMLYKPAALWRAVYGRSSNDRTLGTSREEKEISSWFRVSIPSRYDLDFLS